MPGVRVGPDGKMEKYRTEDDPQPDEDATPAVQAAADAIEGAVDASDEILAGLLGDPEQQNVEVVEVLVGDTILAFGIATLSIRETNALLRKRLRAAPGGKMMPVADSDVILRVQALAQCVKRNTGTAAEPVWAPRWTFDQVAGTPKVKGLIDNASQNAQELINGLLQEVWARNPTIAPLYLDAMEVAIALQAKNSLGG